MSRVGEIDLRRDRFRVTVIDQRFIRLEMPGWCQNLLPTVSADTVGALDRRRWSRLVGLGRRGEGERITWEERSTLWTKEHHVEVHGDYVLLRCRLLGRGVVDTVRFFDVIEDAGFVEHFALVKHFNDGGRTTAGTSRPTSACSRSRWRPGWTASGWRWALRSSLASITSPRWSIAVGRVSGCT